jgi:DHA3 family tetracycline resistance protein-like MFS transporter
MISALSWTTTVLYLVEDVGLTPLLLVLAGTALEVAYLLFEVPTGVLADAVSRRLSMVVAAAGSGVAMITVGLAPNAAVVLAGMALWGLAWTFRSGAEDAWVADELGAAALGCAYQVGAQVGRVAGLAGIAAAVGLSLLDRRLPVLAAGVAALLLALWIALRLPEQSRIAAEQVTASPWRTARAGWRIVASSTVLLLLFVVMVLTGAWSESWDRLWEALLILEVGFPSLDPAVWFGLLAAAALLLAAVIVQPLLPSLSGLGRVGLARLMAVLVLAVGVSAVAFATSGSLLAAVPAYLAVVVCRDVMGPLSSTFLNLTITDSARRATVLSLLNVGDSAGELAGGPAIGVVADARGLRTALLLSALLLVPVVALWGGLAYRSQGDDGERPISGPRP